MGLHEMTANALGLPLIEHRQAVENKCSGKATARDEVGTLVHVGIVKSLRLRVRKSIRECVCDSQEGEGTEPMRSSIWGNESRSDRATDDLKGGGNQAVSSYPAER